MTDDDRETFLDITEHLKWDAPWWVTILMIEKLTIPSREHPALVRYDSLWDRELAYRDDYYQNQDVDDDRGDRWDGLDVEPDGF